MRKLKAHLITWWYVYLALLLLAMVAGFAIWCGYHP